MSYVALYRKFRPSTFSEVRGQDHVVRTLRNQVKTDRLQHAYLFSGTRGTGKTSVAKILARAVNCEHPDDGNPCGVCPSCKRIADAASMNVIEIDAASNNGVDHIREIIDEVQYRPTDARYKVYIIDEVHMLSAGAFNALLKTLEEPPDYVIFILATTEAGKIPVTILSRCQRYDFRRIDTATIAGRMRELLDIEGVEAEEKALRFIARTADGSMRDALSLLDRCIAFYMNETLTYERALTALGEADTSVFARLTGEIKAGRAASALRIFGKKVAEGAEVGQFISDYIGFLRNLLIVITSDEEDAREIIDATEEQMAELRSSAQDIDADTVMRFIRILSDLLNRMRYASDRRILAETALLTLVKPESDGENDALKQRIRELERKLEALEAAGGAAPVIMQVSAAKEAEDSEEKEALPPGAPEDLRTLLGDWKHFVSELPSSILKQQLMENAHPQFNADTLENKLYVEFGTGTGGPAADVVLLGDWRAELEKQIERTMRKHIDVEFHLAKARPAGVHTVDIDRLIRDRIGMEVEESEDDEDI